MFEGTPEFQKTPRPENMKRIFRVAVAATTLFVGAREAGAAEHRRGPEEAVATIAMNMQSLAEQSKPTVQTEINLDMTNALDRILRDAGLAEHHSESTVPQDRADVDIKNLKIGEGMRVQADIGTKFGTFGLAAEHDDGKRDRGEIVFTPKKDLSFVGLSPGARVILSPEGRPHVSITFLGATGVGGKLDYELMNKTKGPIDIAAGFDQGALCVAPSMKLGKGMVLDAMIYVGKNGPKSASVMLRVNPEQKYRE